MQAQKKGLNLEVLSAAYGTTGWVRREAHEALPLGSTVDSCRGLGSPGPDILDLSSTVRSLQLRRVLLIPELKCQAGLLKWRRLRGMFQSEGWNIVHLT